ncbi:MAG: endonuclease/exonuclease/phosphatase family protein [Coriobacteriia bacterium]
MRIVSWNANYNGRRHSFDSALEMLEPLQPDIVVLCETAPPSAPDGSRVCRVGAGTPGLAVVALGEYELEPHPLNDGAPPLAAGFSVHGPHELHLVAAWPVQRTGGATYHQVLTEAVDRYEGFLTAGPAMLIGDLNSSTRVTSQQQTHPQFVQRAEELGLRSLYHEQSGEAHGDELVPTYRHQNRAEQPFHIDYCFASADLRAGARLTVLDSDEWWGRSDHCPIVVEV